MILELSCADMTDGIEDPCGSFQLRIFYDSTTSALEKYQEASPLQLGISAKKLFYPILTWNMVDYLRLNEKDNEDRKESKY